MGCTIMHTITIHKVLYYHILDKSIFFCNSLILEYSVWKVLEKSFLASFVCTNDRILKCLILYFFILKMFAIFQVLPEEQEEFEEMASHPVCGAKNPVRIWSFQKTIMIFRNKFWDLKSLSCYNHINKLKFCDFDFNYSVILVQNLLRTGTRMPVQLLPNQHV